MKYALLALLLAAPVSAQTSQQTVSVTVPLAQVFEVDPDDVELVLATPTPTGFAPVTATSSYDISVNLFRIIGVPWPQAFKITGHLTEAYDTGVRLAVEFQAPRGLWFSTVPRSTGRQDLPVGIEDAVTLVDGIRWAIGDDRRITYTASADLTAVPGSYSRTVVYTISQE